MIKRHYITISNIIPIQPAGLDYERERESKIASRFYSLSRRISFGLKNFVNPLL